MLQTIKSIFKNRIICIVLLASFACGCGNGRVPVGNKEIIVTSLIDAVIEGAASGVSDILTHDQNIVFINSRDCRGVTPLMYASRYGRTSVVMELLKHGANPNLRNTFGVTPLMLASLHGYKEIVIDLLKNGADPNLTNNHGVTALMFAVHKNYLGIVIKLLQSGANPNIKDKTNLSALTIAQHNKRKDIVTQLTFFGAKDSVIPGRPH